MRRLPRIALCLIGTLAVFVGASQTLLAQAAIPAIGSTLPQAAAPGQTIDVKIRGGNLAGPTQFWASFPVEAALPTEIAGNGTNAGEITYRLKVPAGAPLGVQGIRVATAQGVSNLKLFAIDDLPSIAQVKPNSTLAMAQAVTPPVAIDGYVDNLARDFYKFQVAAGQRVSFEVLGRRLGSPLDSMIRILDAKGRELAYNDDAPGVGMDSMLSYTFKDAGEYVLEIHDMLYRGGGNFSYRLRIGDFPAVTVPYPMGVQRGVSANIAFAGSAAQDVSPMPVNIADPNLAWLPLAAKSPGGKSSAFALAAVSSEPEAMEVEPNNEVAQGTRVPLGASLNGRFDQPGDVDCFVLTAKAGQRFTFSAVNRPQGSPSDAYLRLLKSDGAEVAGAGDAGPGEGVIDYTFPADGDYTLIVKDLEGHGGPEYAYRIAVAPHAEKFSLSASADTINVAQGGLAMVTVTAARGSFGGPISLSLLDAPSGIVATPAVIGPGLTSAVLTIQCPPSGVEAGKVYPVRIAGTAQSGNVQYQAIASVTDAQKAAFSGLPVPPPYLSPMIAIAVNPAPLFSLKTDKPQIIFGKDLSATVKVISTRAEGFGEDIALAITPPPPQPGGLPPGVTAAVKPIAKGTNEIEIAFSANNQAPIGEYSVVLVGTGKLGDKTATQPIPALSVSLRAPFVLKPDFAGGKLAKGQTLKVKIAAERNPAYAGAITLAFQNLPKGVTAAAAMIAAGQNEVEVVLTAAADAAVGAVQNIVVQGEGMNGNAKLAAASPATALTVE